MAVQRLKSQNVFIHLSAVRLETPWIIIQKAKLLISYTFNSEPSYPLSV